jgi:hypothetical protein
MGFVSVPAFYSGCGLRAQRMVGPRPSSSILSVIGLAEVDRKRLDFVRWMTYSCWSSTLCKARMTLVYGYVSISLELKQ